MKRGGNCNGVKGKTKKLVIVSKNNQLNMGSSRELNCIDLFAGAGGFSLAAKNMGFKVLAAVEINNKACETYNYNIVDDGVPVLYREDITVLSPSVLAKEHFAGGRECHLLLGGPPCQGFSVHRNDGSGVGDPRNKLILRYFEYVKVLRPKIFLMENVPGILWPRHKHFLEDFYRQGKDAGYSLRDPVVIDARDYGVPQRRQRVFILGIRNDLSVNICWPPRKSHENPRTRSLDSTLKAWVPAKGIFLDKILDDDENNVHMNHTQELVDLFRRTPLNGGSRKDSGRTLPCHAHHDGHNDVYGRIDIGHPGPTMTTACINPSKGRFVHPFEHHGITLRHAARFQTFPEWFVFKGGLMAAGVQIGNAVPIRLAEVLIASLKDALTAPGVVHD